jgi:ubiquitin C-terminal hydrolase
MMYNLQTNTKLKIIGISNTGSGTYNMTVLQCINPIGKIILVYVKDTENYKVGDEYSANLTT